MGQVAVVIACPSAPPGPPTAVSGAASVETKLKVYALFKQDTEGDANGPRPVLMELAGTFKYDAWSKLKGMSKKAATRAYIELLESTS